MNRPRFTFDIDLEESEFTRVQPGDYLQIIVEDEPSSDVSLTAGSLSSHKCFIFETKPTSRSGQE
jgi:hypothetical protein